MTRKNGCLVWIVVVAAALGSCRKSSPPRADDVTPLQALINTDTSFSLYHRMLLAANETGLLADNSVTLLVPTNEAFRAAGYSELFIDSLRPSIADRIVSYHFIRQRAEPATHEYTPFPTHLGFSIFGQLGEDAVVRFNGSSASDTLQVSKALIYRLNSVLLAPVDSLAYQLSLDCTLAFTTALFARTRLDTTLLKMGGTYTVLAPINSAWMNAGYDSVWRIDSADLHQMVETAKYHVLTEQFFSNTLMGITSVTSLQGTSYAVGLAGGVIQFTRSGAPGPASVLMANQPAGNVFVIHKVDRLLSP